MFESNIRGGATDSASQAHDIDTDVAIVGAGPVGLALANILGLQGLRVQLLEQLDKIIDYPRAIGIDDESLRVFQAVGLVDKLLPHTTPDHWMRFVDARGRCFASIEPRTDEFGWPRRNAFNQPQADQVLFDGLKRFPGIEVRFGTTVQSFSQHEDGVLIETIDAEQRPRRVRCKYMLGCDGGNSFVRRSLGLAFDGRTKPNQWIVVDVLHDPVGTPHIYLHCDDERPYVSAALPHGIRRFEFMVMPGETEEQLSRPENLAALMRKVVSDPERVEYIRKRVYTHNARLAPTFRVRRVLLAGDAAHIMPVWQGQGYNSGLRDAINLGWKLAMVIHGTAGEALLDSYTAERREHARSMIHLSEVAGDIVAPLTPLARLYRNALVGTLSLVPAAKRYLVEMRFKPMPRYEEGVVLLPGQRRKAGLLAKLLERMGASAPGRLLQIISERRSSWLGRLVHGPDLLGDSPVGRLFIQPWVRTRAGERQRLDDVVGNRLVLLGWGSDPSFGLSPRERELWIRLGGCFVLAVPDVQLHGGPDAQDHVIVVGDAQGRLREWFGSIPQSVVLLRPDRFVAGVCTPQEASKAVAALARKLDAVHGDRARPAAPFASASVSSPILPQPQEA